MKIHLATVGVRSQQILVGIKNIGAEKVYLFATKGVENETYPIALEIRENLGKLLIDVPEIVEVELFDLIENVKRMIKVIRAIKTEAPTAELYFNVSGGTKIMASSALIASYMEGVKPYYVVEKPGGLGPIVMLPALPKKGVEALSVKQREALLKLKKLKSANLRKLAEEAGIAIPSAKYIVERFQEMGIVERVPGKGMTVKLTELGEFWAWLAEISLSAL
jgi:predicted transcriptional regulator